MRRIAKPTTQMPVKATEQLLSSDTDAETLLAKAYYILQREIANMMVESASGKLNKDSARDLVAYVKLLSDIKLDQEELLNNLTTDQLNEVVKKSDT